MVITGVLRVKLIQAPISKHHSGSVHSGIRESLKPLIKHQVNIPQFLVYYMVPNQCVRINECVRIDVLKLVPLGRKGSICGREHGEFIVRAFVEEWEEAALVHVADELVQLQDNQAVQKSLSNS